MIDMSGTLAKYPDEEKYMTGEILLGRNSTIDFYGLGNQIYNKGKLHEIL